MRVLVLGRQGQVARALVERAAGSAFYDLAAIGRPDIDLEVPGSVERAIRSASPDVVINAAAYTAVDQAEDEPDRAFRINAQAAGEAAAAAKSVDAAFVQISTDYVFDGRSESAYRENDPTHPLGVYGASKLAGEEEVRQANAEHLIVRTAWVYSPFGRNFVGTMLRLASGRDEVRVVADQFGSPTSALDLADALLHAVEKRRGGTADGCGRTYHVAGSGRCSWADLADQVFVNSAVYGGPRAVVRRIATCEFPTKAVRPVNSVLDSSKFEREFDFRMPRWEESVEAVVHRFGGRM